MSLNFITEINDLVAGKAVSDNEVKSNDVTTQEQYAMTVFQGTLLSIIKVLLKASKNDISPYCFKNGMWNQKFGRNINNAAVP